MRLADHEKSPTHMQQVTCRCPRVEAAAVPRPQHGTLYQPARCRVKCHLQPTRANKRRMRLPSKSVF